MKKNFILRVIFSIATAIMLTTLIFSFISVAQNSAYERPIIIIDAGHGGFDGGAVAGDGTVEKDINMQITFKLREILEFSGFSVIMTREGDVATDSIENAAIALRKKSDLDNRLALMKRYKESLFVSIHLNKFTTSSASGAQVFYSQKNSESFSLAESIQNSIVSMVQPENKRVIKCGNKNAYLLKNATVPAVIVECGFLSNHRELELLKDEEYQSKISFAIAAGIINFDNKGE